MVAHSGAPVLLRNRFDRFVHRGGKLLNEILHEVWNIRFSFAQWWQINREDIQSVVQVFTEFTILSHSLQVWVGRRNNANVDSRCPRAAHCLKLTLLQDAKQFGLKL